MTITPTQTVSEVDAALTEPHHDVLAALRFGAATAQAVADEVSAIRQRRNRGRPMHAGRARRLLVELRGGELVYEHDGGQWSLTPAGEYVHGRRNLRRERRSRRRRGRVA